MKCFIGNICISRFQFITTLYCVPRREMVSDIISSSHPVLSEFLPGLIISLSVFSHLWRKSSTGIDENHIYYTRAPFIPYLTITYFDGWHNIEFLVGGTWPSCCVPRLFVSSLCAMVLSDLGSTHGQGKIINVAVFYNELNIVVLFRGR